MPESNKPLGKRILSGSVWIAALEISNQLLQFVKTFYAANLLTPKDFGIVGFAFLIIGLLEILSTTGMKEAVIQKKDDLAPYLNTVWTVELSKGVIVLLATFFLSPVLSRALSSSNPQLTDDVVKFIGAIYFLQCSMNIGVVYFEKNIQFKKFFLYQFSGTVADVAVSLVLVYYLRNVWALFYGVLAGYTVRVIFSFILSDFKPRLSFKYDRAKELLRYGRWIFGGRIFNFVGLQSDSIIVSSFFSLYFLGVYQMAFRIGNLPMSQVSNIIGRLAFPTFSKLQDDLPKLKDFFLTAMNFLSIVLLPLVILVFSLIQEFTSLFLGSRWSEIVPIVQVLIVSGFLRIFVSLIDSLLCAIGLPKFSSYLQSSRFIIFILLVYPLAHTWGILGIAISACISLAGVFVFFLRDVCIRLEISLKEIIQNLGYPTLYGLFVFALLYGFKYWCYQNSIINFLLLAGATLVLYFGLGFLLNKYSKVTFFGKIISLVQSNLIKL